jgi:hypothetical protein
MPLKIHSSFKTPSTGKIELQCVSMAMEQRLGE